MSIDQIDQSSSTSLNQHSLEFGVLYLSKIDPDIKRIVDIFGFPPLWFRVPGFPTLIHIILEQQVSLASAKAAFQKLSQACGEITPGRFLEFSDIELKGIGFSRQKTEYGRDLSNKILNGELEIDQLHYSSDAEAKNKLIQVKGIGQWTADIYLLMALLRPDIWPSGDLALSKAVQEVKNLEIALSHESLKEIAEGWKPWRSVAARIFWHYYLSS